ncbi:MAG: tetratricopeptide repeat protein [Herpetosiphon sp.]
MPTGNESFGLWVKQRRAALDLTRVELALRVGCALETIRKIERDERRPSKQIATRLAMELSIPLEARAAFVQWARATTTATGYLGDPSILAVQAQTDATLTSPSNLATGIPVALTPLIGRDDDMRAVQTTLLRTDVRLLTLLGPPGVGKTRLALQVAAEVATLFPQGASFIALATVTDMTLVWPAIARHFGLQVSAGQAPIDTVRRYLQARQQLLVLDNCEQVIGVGPQLAALLQNAPDIKLLVTSRAALRIRGEHEYVVPPLAVPPREAPSEPTVLLRFPAIALLLARAQTVKPQLRLTHDNGHVLADISRRLDGLPLALELAAARLRVFTPEALWERLKHSFDLLKHGHHDVPPHQLSLRDAISWSYQLLAPSEQRLLRRLAVFRGASLQAVEQVVALAGDLPSGVASGMEALVAQSVIQYRDLPAQNNRGEGRFTLLELIREYALEQLQERGEEASVRHVHAAYFLDVVEQSHVPPATYADVESEIDNVQEALRWWLRDDASKTERELGLRLAVALYPFWELRGYWIEARHWLEEALARAIDAPVRLRATAQAFAGSVLHALGDLAAAQSSLAASLALRRADDDLHAIADSLRRLGWLAYNEGDLTRARVLYEECHTFCCSLGDSTLLADTLNGLGAITYVEGDVEQGQAYFEAALKLYRSLGATVSVLTVLRNLGEVVVFAGDTARGVALFEESLALARQIRHQEGISEALYSLGGLAQAANEMDRAARLFDESLALARQLGRQELIARVLCSRGYTALRKQEVAPATQWLAESLRVCQSLKLQVGIYECLLGLAEAAISGGMASRGACLLGAVAKLHAPHAAMSTDEQGNYDRVLTAVRSCLREATITAAWTAGHAMQIDDAITFALNITRR